MEGNIRKIKISADNMSTALRIVKERYGADAYILHEEQKDSRVHLVVATHAEENEEHSSDKHSDVYLASPNTNSIERSKEISLGFKPEVNNDIDKLTVEEIPNEKRIAELSREVASIKAYLEQNIPKIVFQKYENDSAVKSLILKKMLSNGYSLDFASAIVNKLPDTVTARNYLNVLREVLTKMISTSNLIDSVQGKKVLFVGPGGAGKTTAIIKLLKNLVERQSPEQINVVGMPSNCIAEHESLKRYSEIMNCNFIELAKATQEDMTFICRPNTTTLIDTTQYVHNKIETIQDVKRILKILKNKVYVVLVISASTNTELIEKIIISMKSNIQIDGIILTKMDEVTQTGGVVEQAISNNLTIVGMVNSGDKTQSMYLNKDEEIILKTLENAVNNKFTEVSLVNNTNIKNIGVKDAI